MEQFFLCLDGCPMTSDALRSLIERISQASGVPRLHPHLIRHTYATRFLLNGGDVFLLKQKLGHTTLTMVERYVHMSSQMAAVASQAFSPLDRVEHPVLRKGRRRGNKKGSEGAHKGRSRALSPDSPRRARGSRCGGGPAESV